MHFKKTLSTTSLAILTSCLLSTQTFAAEFNGQPILNVEPCTDSTDEDRLGLRAKNTKSLSGILLSAAITAGIDLIGQKLTEGAEESTEVKTVVVNIFPNSEIISARCLTFKTSEMAYPKRSSNKSRAIEFDLRLDGHGYNGGVPYYMRPKLTELRFQRTLSGKLNKKRGLMIQLAISGPGTTIRESQTISLGNLRTQDEPYSRNEQDNHIEFPTMINPYVRKGADGKDNVGGPFTITVTLTEVKDANKALGFAAAVFSEANDDLTATIIGEVTGPPDDDGT
ncbi:MAG: hypothetical protein ABJ275_10265 [Maricaulaceae bacterium]